MNWVLIGVIAYIVLQFTVGAWVSRRISTETDYLLGGRQLGFWLASFSVYATWFGVETVMGSAGRVYKDGLAGAQGEPFAYAVAIILMALLLARRLWARGIVTFGDFFRQRYSPGVERLAVLMLIPGSVLWAAAQIRGFGQVMSSTAGMSLTYGMTLAAVIVVAYTALGGLLADVYTDFIQGIAIVLGLLAMFFVVATQLGGPVTALATVPAEKWAPMTADQPLLEFLEQWAIPIGGSLVAVELISRVLACRSAEVARTATAAGGVFYLLLALIPVFFGLVGHSLLPGLKEPEQLVPELARTLLPTFLYVLFAGALISAILSTVDSALLAAASLLTHNLVLRFRPETDEARKVAISRAGVAVLGLLAFALGLRAEGISSLVELASAFATAGVCVTALFGLLGKFGGPASAYAAMIVGSAVWAGLRLAEFPAPYLSALGAALIAYVVLGFVAKPVGAITTVRT